MSIVSTLFSSRSSSRVNARLIFLMDNLLAIGFGLGLRFVVNTTSPHDFRLASTLIGLWEGVVTLHFLKKMPNSPDPFIGYGVRLFVDFVATENLTRLVLVIIWTGLGMVLADIAPAIWHDVGAHRIWRRFRRDMYYITRSVPPLPSIPPLFPRARVVRFSPVIEPTEISETISTASPTAATPTITTTRTVPPPSSVPRVAKRPVPGNFPASVISETDTEAASALGLRQGADPSAAGTPHTRFTVRPRRSSIDSGSTRTPLSTAADDSTSDASSVSTETPSQVVEIEEDIEVVVRSRDKGKGKERAVERGDSDTPLQRSFELPPTPSDSARPHLNRRPSFVPTISGMPSIPDFFESGLGSDWENIKREDAQGFPSPPVKEIKKEDVQDVLSPVKDSVSPPVHYIPPPSTYEPTPRPTTFDQDLWDDVSNAAPPTPYKRASPKQRTSRLPSRIPVAPAMVPTIPKPIVRKRKSDPPPPPPVPQTPLYGSAWDTEADRLPPQTPSVLARTPIHEPTFSLNNNDQNEAEAPPVDLNTTHPVDNGAQKPSQPPDTFATQQNVAETSTGFDNPWDDPSTLLPPQGSDQQQENQSQGQETLPPVPPTPQFKPRPSAPPTPAQQSRTVPPTPSQHPGTVPPTPGLPSGPVPPTPGLRSVQVPPTPGQQSRTVPPTPSQHPGTVPLTPGLQSGPVPPTPGLRSVQVPPTPGQRAGTVPPTPNLRSGMVPPTPGIHSGQIPPTPGLRSEPIPPTPSVQAGPVPPTPGIHSGQIPPTPGLRSSPVPPTPGQRSGPIPPTPGPHSGQIPPTPGLRPGAVPPTPQQQPGVQLAQDEQQQESQFSIPQPKSRVSPTPQQQSQTIPPTPQQPLKNIPGTPLQQSKPVPPTPQVKPKTPPTATPQQQTKPVPLTPQPPLGNILPTPQQRMKSMPPTPQMSTQPVLPTPQPLKQSRGMFDDLMEQVDSLGRTPTPQMSTQPVLPTPQPLKQSRGMFEDLMEQVDNLGRTPTAETEDPLAPTQPSQPAGELFDLAGDGNVAGGGQSGNGENVNENNGNEHVEEPGAGDDPANAEPTGEGEPVQFDEHNNPLSPASSGYSSVAGVPSEIKERNKQAIVIRAQIAEVEKSIENLKEQKLRAEGKEELDPLSEESTLKGLEIQKAEKSLEKLKKRAMKRHQAAIDSTQLLTLPKELKVSFEGTSAAKAVVRLEDLLGLYFAPDQKSMKIQISFAKDGAGKTTKEALTKVFKEYGIKAIPKVGGLVATMTGKTYLDMIAAFRQKHTQADDS